MYQTIYQSMLLDGMPSPASDAPIHPLVATAIKNAALKPFNNKKLISGRREPCSPARMRRKTRHLVVVVVVVVVVLGSCSWFLFLFFWLLLLLLLFSLLFFFVAAVASMPPVYKSSCHCFCGSLRVKHPVLSAHLVVW